jgi:hypothetical protein
MGEWIKITRPLVFKPPSYRRVREVRSSGKPVHSRHVGARNEDAFSGSPFSLIPPVIVTDHCTLEGTELSKTRQFTATCTQRPEASKVDSIEREETRETNKQRQNLPTRGNRGSSGCRPCSLRPAHMGPLKPLTAVIAGPAFPATATKTAIFLFNDCSNEVLG